MVMLWERSMPRRKSGRKPGRPATGKGQTIGVRIQPVPLSALDAFVADQEKTISRPAAIRMILMKFFRSNGYLSKA
jgi:hypothetical protein